MLLCILCIHGGEVVSSTTPLLELALGTNSTLHVALRLRTRSEQWITRWKVLLSLPVPHSSCPGSKRAAGGSLEARRGWSWMRPRWPSLSLLRCTLLLYERSVKPSLWPGVVSAVRLSERRRSIMTSAQIMGKRALVSSLVSSTGDLCLTAARVSLLSPGL